MQQTGSDSAIPSARASTSGCCVHGRSDRPSTCACENCGNRLSAFRLPWRVDAPGVVVLAVLSPAVVIPIPVAVAMVAIAPAPPRAGTFALVRFAAVVVVRGLVPRALDRLVGAGSAAVTAVSVSRAAMTIAIAVFAISTVSRPGTLRAVVMVTVTTLAIVVRAVACATVIEAIITPATGRIFIVVAATVPSGTSGSRRCRD